MFVPKLNNLFRIDASKQSKGDTGEKCIRGLNYRLQYALLSSNTFVEFTQRSSILNICIPKGFFIAFPGKIFSEDETSERFEIKSFENYKELNENMFGYKQTSFKKSFYVHGSLSQLRIRKYNSEYFESYIKILEQRDMCPYQVFISKDNFPSAISIEVNLSELCEQEISRGKSAKCFLIGYSTSYNPIPYMLKDFVPKGFQTISQTSSSTNQKFIANFGNFFRDGLMKLMVLQSFCQSGPVIQTHDKVLDGTTENETGLSDNDITEEDNFFDTYEQTSQYDSSTSVTNIQDAETKWFTTHNTMPVVYDSDNISYLLAKLPPQTMYSEDSINIYDLMKISLHVPNDYLWMWNKNDVEIMESSLSTNTTLFSKIPITIERIHKTGVCIYPFQRETVMLTNPNIQFPLYILVESNICHSNLVLGQSSSFPVLAILRKGMLDNGYFKTQMHYQLHYNPHSNQYLCFRIVDRFFNDVILSGNSYFTLQITRTC